MPRYPGAGVGWQRVDAAQQAPHGGQGGVLYRVGCQVFADQAAQLRVEVDWPGRDTRRVARLQAPPLDGAVEMIARGIDAIYAHHQVARAVHQDAVVAVPRSQYCPRQRRRAQRRVAVPVAPLGQGLVQLQLDCVR